MRRSLISKHSLLNIFRMRRKPSELTYRYREKESGERQRTAYNRTSRY